LQALEQLADDAWHRIHDGHQLGVTQGEESLSDHLLLQLRRINPAGITVLKTPKNIERHKGTDWEWWIGSPQRGWIRYAVQAKKLNLRTGRYDDLAHRIGRRLQVDILRRYAAVNHAVALYCLYNYTDASDLAPFWRCPLPCQDSQLGCTVTPAEEVRRAIGKRGCRTFTYFHQRRRTVPWRCLVRCPQINAIHQGDRAGARVRFGHEITLHRTLPPGFLPTLNGDGGELEAFSPEYYDPTVEYYPRRIMVIDTSVAGAD